MKKVNNIDKILAKYIIFEYAKNIRALDEINS